MEAPQGSASALRQRERRRQRHRDQPTDPDPHLNYSDYEAGPSRLRSKEETRDRDTGEPRRKKKKSKSKKDKETSVLDGAPNGTLAVASNGGVNPSFDIGEDFVAFAPSSGDEEVDKLNEEQIHEWDKGKGRAQGRGQERYTSGTKRKYDMVFDEDEMLDVRYHSRSSSRKAPWVEFVDWESCSNVAETLHREVEAFVNYISPTHVEDEIRSLVVDMVSKAVTETFPDAKVLPFGSFGTKLYLPLGDIDLVVVSESMAYSDKVHVLQALANALKRAKIASKVTIIAKAKVPIVKFITTHGRLNVDISVNQGNGVVASQIVNGFLKDMHGGGMALRSLVMITKAFLSQRSMNEVYTGGLGSYSIVCLAISFLQMHPKVRSGEIDAAKNLGVLVMEFFELYGCYFNYEEVGISVRDGGIYFSKQHRGWQSPYKRYLLSIEDPTDTSNDIASGSFAIQKVRTTFAGAFGILTAAAYMRNGMIRSKRKGQSFSLRDFSNPGDASVLASILGVTQETINHRKLIQELYDAKTLHGLLGIEPKKDDVSASGKISDRNGTTKVLCATHEVMDPSQEKGVKVGSDAEETRTGGRSEENEEEESKYGIAARAQPLTKRQKRGNERDLHTVFTTDEEEEDGLIGDLETEEQDDSDPEEGEYFSEQEGLKSNPHHDKRRAYWLSKGIGIDNDSSSN